MILVATQDPRPMADVVDGLPPALCSFVDRALSPRLSSRWTSATEMLLALAKLGPETDAAAIDQRATDRRSAHTHHDALPTATAGARPTGALTSTLVIASPPSTMRLSAPEPPAGVPARPPSRALAITGVLFLCVAVACIAFRSRMTRQSQTGTTSSSLPPSAPPAPSVSTFPDPRAVSSSDVFTMQAPTVTPPPADTPRRGARVTSPPTSSAPPPSSAAAAPPPPDLGLSPENPYR